jgi:tRNA(Ile)-lysidine synthase
MIPKQPVPGLTGDGNRFSVEIMPAEKIVPVSLSEAKSLFSDLGGMPALVLAVSGGPDSTALMVLAARWAQRIHKTRKRVPKLIAVTVDHGLRAESAREAVAVKRLARSLSIEHRTVRWTGVKPKTGLQEAAREARYRLLSDVARKAGAPFVLTAHTLDDQAETVLIRLTRGSGLTGLAAMQRVTPLAEGTLSLVRPLLDIPKARLIATLKAAKIPFAQDPSNRDPRFTRVRVRDLMPALGKEGLDARRLALLARRLRRADAALAREADRALTALARPGAVPRSLELDAAGYAALPDEIGLRLLACALAPAADGAVGLGKLEALKAALDAAQEAGTGRFRRSLAGAMVTLAKGKIAVEPAPPRRPKALTKSESAPPRGKAPSRKLR